MIFSELIRHLDATSFIKIYTSDYGNEPEYEGAILDIPWYFLEYELDTSEKDEYEAIGTCTYISEEGAKLPAICITLKQPKIDFSKINYYLL